MSTQAWQYALASVVGTSHKVNGLPCQDASDCQLLADPDGGAVLVAIASDGAGSASRSDEGAQIACASVMADLRSYFSSGGRLADISRPRAQEWLARFRSVVESRAESENCVARDFACTLLVAIIGRDIAVFMQIGDGAIVVSRCDDDEYTWVFWPQRGEYENTTYFATEDRAAEILEFESVSGSIEEVAVFTDGIQSLALHYTARSAYEPFFTPIFETMRSASLAIQSSLSESLAAYLASATVNARTDDDKTLIVATRRCGTEHVDH